MRKTILAALAVAMATPADACHRFLRWYYPYPQRCTVTHETPPDRSWYVELVFPADERAAGIEQLKKALTERAQQ